jgi:hypothetical protein
VPLHHCCDQVKKSLQIETCVPVQNVLTALYFNVHVVYEALIDLR